MRNLFKAMATFMKKFKRKRRVSTELHSRWGDVSISYPLQGSWNHPSRAAIQPEDSQQYNSPGPVRQRSHSTSSRVSRSTSTRELHPESPPFPTGYFDQNIRRRVGERHTPPAQGFGPQELGGDYRREASHRPPSSIIHDESASDDSSCDGEEEEDDEERDTLGPRVRLSPRDFGMGEISPATRDNEDFDIPAKSPPLSVTSRMRRCSIQSCATEPTASISGGTSSRRTSFTAASSISAPSMPPSTPRYGYHTLKQPPFPEKRYPSRVKQTEPECGPPQELVPSYDELYG
ncbi:uncharacterized protein N7515_001621 [Penicillium bovifimosum]|uniref:Uncharacterized protein n=1 Tax=Penicillium bovifimosum TaxID=126998 RepID=A0A9W9HAA5_9EURO|nr:uncharacterized protein N7515_001621 [Penicillium bovifimosum]KAJ5142834.1 hypothetical protein N7515_001621 [Penicillium bovifimosum]